MSFATRLILCIARIERVTETDEEAPSNTERVSRGAVDGVMSQSRAQLNPCGMPEKTSVKPSLNGRHTKRYLSRSYGAPVGDIDVVNQEYPDLKSFAWAYCRWQLHPTFSNRTIFQRRNSRRAATRSSLIFDVVRRFNGSISAEHGVGLPKEYLHHTSATEIELW